MFFSRKAILFILVCAVCGYLDAQTRVALIPAAPELVPVADQVLAAMANDVGVGFLERANIETVLKERKLSASGLTSSNLAELGKLIHADLFAVITAKMGKKEEDILPSGLIIYDASNGFRLANIALPEKQEDCIGTVVEQMRKALEVKKHPEKQILMSLVTVRDAGVPERFKYQQAFIAADLERRLGGIPNVTLLERDYLENVNLERKLTEQMFKLAPSARLLRLEFIPGSSPEIVNLTLRVTDAANNELFRYEEKNCFTGNTAEKMAAALAGYLKEPLTPTMISAASEANRFFREFYFFRSHKEYGTARSKLNAAIALDPQFSEYRIWQMVLNQEEIPPGDYKRILETDMKNMDLAMELKPDFPDNRFRLYTRIDIFPRTNFHEGSTPQEFSDMALWAAAWRPLYEEEYCRRRKPDFDLSDGINSHAEWQTYNKYCLEMSRFELYYDCNVWADAVNKIALEHLKVGRELAVKHPEWFDPHSLDKSSFRLTMRIACLVRDLRDRSTLDSKAVGENILSGCNEYIAQSANHPLPQSRIDALQLKLMQKAVKNKYDSTGFASLVTEYCNQGAAVDGKVFEAVGIRDIVIFFGEKSDYGKLAVKVKKEFLNPNNQPDTMDTLFATVNAIADPGEKANKVLELAPEFLKYREQAFVDVKARDFFFKLGAELSYAAYSKQNELCRKALDVLNKDVSIDKIADVSIIQEKKDKNSRMGIQNVLLDGDILNLLLSQKTKGKEGMRESWAIARLDIKTAETQKLTPWTEPAEIPPYRNVERRPPFAIENDLVTIAGNKTVYVMSLKENTFHEIKDLPSPTVMGLAILNRRVYVFAGAEKPGSPRYPHESVNAYESFLFSCDPDGGNRKLHLSTSRDDKRDSLESKAPFSIYTLIADCPRNRLIFNATCRFGSGLWEYNLSSNSSHILLLGHEFIRFSNTPEERVFTQEIDYPITVSNGVIFCSFWNADYYTYDLASDRAELVFSLSDGNAKYCLDSKYHQSKEIIYKPAFFSRAGQIWFGGDNTVKLLTLPDVAQSPLIFMPPTNNTNWHHMVLPHPDGKSAISIDENSIYKVTPR